MHRYIFIEKCQPYDEDIRIPLIVMIRGPGISSGKNYQPHCTNYKH